MTKKQLLLKFYKIINILPFNNGKKGSLKIINEGSIFRNCKFISKGKNNVLNVKSGGYFRDSTFIIYGNDNTISFGTDCRSNEANFYIEDSSNAISVGDKTQFCGKIHLACIEGTAINIGKDCLFSSEIVLRTGDSHSILDKNGKRTNISKNILIGNHVWVGHKVLINKGVTICNNSVVGTGSVVTKPFSEANIVVAGVPAIVVKHNINWDNERK